MIDLLFPRRCALCGSVGPALCPPCVATLPPAPARPPPAGLEACWALLAYDGAARDLVAELKYRNHRDALDTVGRALAVLLRELVAGPPSGTRAVITWAPTSRRRRRQRGYDQAHLLARRAASHAGAPTQALLSRQPGAPQTGADRAHRLVGPSFRARTVHTPTVVVVDDVWTTGATLSAAARALRAGGAERVLGLVLAARP